MMFQDYCLIPQDFTTKKNPVFLIENGTHAVGRKTLSEVFGVDSTTMGKKLNVSRFQIELKRSSDKFSIICQGLNPSMITRRNGKTIILEKGDKEEIYVGDHVSLLQSCFNFLLEKKNFLRGIAGELILIKDQERGAKELESKRKGRTESNNKKSKKQKTDKKHKKEKKTKTSNGHSKKKSDDNDDSDSDKWGQIEDSSRSSRKKVISYADWPSSDLSSDSSDPDVEEEAKDKWMITGLKETEPKKKKPKSIFSMKKKYNYVETVLSDDQVSDGTTAIFYSQLCLQHLVPKWHFEKPQRLESIMEGLSELLSKYPKTIKLIEDITPITEEILSITHTQHYIEKIQNSTPFTDSPTHVTQYTQEPDERNPEEDFDTFMSKSSYEAALIACGAAKQAIDSVHSGQFRNAFCAVRPPGHHCGSKGHTEGAHSQGYCIINNVAVAALYAKLKYNYSRIAVVDYDVHHGNGTEEILAGKEGFLFVSVHVADLYPHTGGNDIKRASNIVNIGLLGGDGPTKFQEAFDKKIIPALEKFNPDFILLSSGFDAHRNDPTDALRLSETDYLIITEKIKKVADKCCNGRIVSVLEGGYHLESLKRCVREHVIGLIKK